MDYVDFKKITNIVFIVTIFGVITACSNPVNDVIKTEVTQKEPVQISEKVEELQATVKDSSTSSFVPASAPVNPLKITIPSINVEAEIHPYGMDDTGRMAVPEDPEEVGWYKYGVTPGSAGNAVLAGHVDSKVGPAVFFYLKDLKTGDKIHITNANGEELVFEVKDSQKYSPEDAPMNEIFGPSETKSLNLITCTGYFDRSVGHYEERLVVFTELISEI